MLQCDGSQQNFAACFGVVSGLQKDMGVAETLFTTAAAGSVPACVAGWCGLLK